MQIEILDYKKATGEKTKGYVTILLFNAIQMTFRLRFFKKLYVEMPKMQFYKNHYHCIRFIDKVQSDAFQKQVLELLEQFKKQKSVEVKQ